MRRVFLDTSGLVAAAFETEAAHAAAERELALLRREGVPMVLHQGIVIELLDTLSTATRRLEGLRIAATLEAGAATGTFTVYDLTESLIRDGKSLYAARPDKEWGLTDCISFVLMRELEIHEALTLDHHFEQAGLVRLIRSD